MKTHFKLCLVFFLLGLLLFANAGLANAALVEIKQDGQAIWTVLSSQDDANEKKSLEIVDVATQDFFEKSAVVALARNKDKLELSVTTSSGTTTKDITDYHDEIIEVEEQRPARRLTIVRDGDDFAIVQSDVTAKTAFALTIDTKQKQLLAETRTGKRIIEMLPQEVFDNVRRAGLLDTLVSSDKKIVLAEGEQGELEYQLEGQRNIKVLNLLELNADVKLAVSATTGEVLKAEKPVWLDIASFLFS